MHLSSGFIPTKKKPFISIDCPVIIFLISNVTANIRQKSPILDLFKFGTQSKAYKYLSYFLNSFMVINKCIDSSIELL